MTRNECVNHIFQMYKCINAIAKMYDPEINHVSMYSIGDAIGLTMFNERDEEDGRDIVLDANLFSDGSMKINGDYFDRNGKFEFSANTKEESA